MLKAPSFEAPTGFREVEVNESRSACSKWAMACSGVAPAWEGRFWMTYHKYIFNYIYVCVCIYLWIIKYVWMYVCTHHKWPWFFHTKGPKEVNVIKRKNFSILELAHPSVFSKPSVRLMDNQLLPMMELVHPSVFCSKPSGWWTTTLQRFGKSSLLYQLLIALYQRQMLSI